MGRPFRLEIEPLKKRKRKPKVCQDCKQPLLLYRGWGSCENCHRGCALPIGYVATYGHHEGKEVYLASAIIRELSQDMTHAEAEKDIEEDLEDRNIFVVWDIEVEK
jgi:hypothetical protein